VGTIAPLRVIVSPPPPKPIRERKGTKAHSLLKKRKWGYKRGNPMGKKRGHEMDTILKKHRGKKSRTKSGRKKNGLVPRVGWCYGESRGKRQSQPGAKGRLVDEEK